MSPLFRFSHVVGRTFVLSYTLPSEHATSGYYTLHLKLQAHGATAVGLSVGVKSILSPPFRNHWTLARQREVLGQSQEEYDDH
jgi:hypothetical protein